MYSNRTRLIHHLVMRLASEVSSLAIASTHKNNRLAKSRCLKAILAMGEVDQIHQLTWRRGLALVQRVDLIKPFQKTM